MTYKKLVLTVNIPAKQEGNGTFGYKRDLFNYATESGKNYAEKVGADFLCVDDLSHFPDYHACWQRFVMFKEEYLNGYDAFVYHDADLVIGDHCPDLFSYMANSNHDWFASIDPGNYRGFTEKRLGLKNPLPGFSYFNSGFLGFKSNKMIAEKALSYMREFKNSDLPDQDCLNKAVHEAHGQYGVLSKHWNSVTDTQESLFNSHYSYKLKASFSVNTERAKQEAKRLTLAKIQDWKTLY